MSARPTHAMMLAAGLGKRMRPVSSAIPKPLVELAGKPLIAYGLDRLIAAGVTDIVVNTHYRAAQIEAYLADFAARDGAPAIRISHEETLLETGGGVRNALRWLGAQPFFVLNSDIVLVDGARPALDRLADAWDDARMDALLVVCPISAAEGYAAAGDFFLAPDGGLTRRGTAAHAPYVFTGVQLLAPGLFDGAPDGPYSLNQHYDEALAAGRLKGVVHDGAMLHVGSPEGLAAAEQHLAAISKTDDGAAAR